MSRLEKLDVRVHRNGKRDLVDYCNKNNINLAEWSREALMERWDRRNPDLPPLVL